MLSMVFKRKTKPAPAAPQPRSAQADPMNPEFLWEVHARALQHVVREGRFQGCLNEMPGFATQTESNGMQVAVNRDKQFQAIMAENVIGLSGVGYSPVQWCLAHLGIFTKHALSGEPDWDTSGDGLSGTLPLGAHAVIDFKCTAQDDIDFDFSGRKETGATLVIKISPRTVQ